MTTDRLQTITDKYASLRIAVIGDFCLDRYLEIDPNRTEISIETGLPVHNVVNVRAQPGGAGTILNNLAALRIGRIFPVGFCGDDGEGFELRRALAALTGVTLAHFSQTPERHTFTYCKPLVVQAGLPPRELERIDTKNWSPTPPKLQTAIIEAVKLLAPNMDGLILLDQVELPNTGVVTDSLLDCIRDIVEARPELVVVADSRRGLRGFPPAIFKMNVLELAALTGTAPKVEIEALKLTAVALARQNRRPVVITLSAQGMIGATPDGQVEHVAARPVRGPIDIVGAGDAVTANLTVALAAGASLREALGLANAAASIVVHQLGTTGTASQGQLLELFADRACD